MRVLLTACLMFFSIFAWGEVPELSEHGYHRRGYILNSESHWRRFQYWTSDSYTDLMNEVVPATFLFYVKMSKAKKNQYTCAIELESTLEGKLDRTLEWIQTLGWDTDSFLDNIYDYAHNFNYLALNNPPTESRH